MQKLSNKQQQIMLPPQYGIVWIFIILSGFMSPLLLIPIVKLVGYTEVVEEAAKALVVLLLILKLPTARSRLLAGAVFGLLFGLSESMFYLTNIMQLGDFSVFWQRLLWTVPMHIGTVIIMVLAGLINRWFIIFGFGGALALHIFFNTVVVKML